MIDNNKNWSELLYKNCTDILRVKKFGNYPARTPIQFGPYFQGHPVYKAYKSVFVC